jgi:serine/threonine protein kinase
MYLRQTSLCKEQRGMGERDGQQLGNYRLLRRLGRGGAAEVYLGEHVFLNTQAAIKVLQAPLPEQDVPAFLREARMIAGLTHPHIIRVLDFGVQDETFYLVMEYAPKGTLRQIYPPGTRLSQSTIAVLVRQIADALQYAHDRNVIHCDVKPEVTAQDPFTMGVKTSKLRI